MRENNDELKLMGALALVLLVFLFISLINDSSRNSPTVNTQPDPFVDINLKAKAVYVYDIRTKEVIFAKDADDRLPLASVTKVMSALVASERYPNTTTVTITLEALSAEGDSGLLVGERWLLKDLLDFSLTTSSNDGIRAVALAGSGLPLQNEKDFVKQMNKKADDLGMLNTYFYNEIGLDESDVKGGAYGSARDITYLFEYVLTSHPQLLEATQVNRESISSLDSTHSARNTNLITNKIPGLLGSKTGFTDIAGGNLVIIFDPEIGRPIIITVLGSTENDRFKDVGTLIEKTLQYLNYKE